MNKKNIYKILFIFLFSLIVYFGFLPSSYAADLYNDREIFGNDLSATANGLSGKSGVVVIIEQDGKRYKFKKPTNNVIGGTINIDCYIDADSSEIVELDPHKEYEILVIVCDEKLDSTAVIQKNGYDGAHNLEGDNKNIRETAIDWVLTWANIIPDYCPEHDTMQDTWNFTFRTTTFTKWEWKAWRLVPHSYETHCYVNLNVNYKKTAKEYMKEQVESDGTFSFESEFYGAPEDYVDLFLKRNEYQKSKIEEHAKFKSLEDAQNHGGSVGFSWILKVYPLEEIEEKDEKNVYTFKRIIYLEESYVAQDTDPTNHTIADGFIKVQKYHYVFFFEECGVQIDAWEEVEDSSKEVTVEEMANRAKELLAGEKTTLEELSTEDKEKAEEAKEALDEKYSIIMSNIGLGTGRKESK